MKKRYLKTALKVVLSAVIILLLLIAAGVAYIKYSGGQDDSGQSVPQAPARPVIKPPKISPKAKESAAVQTITSPIKRGSKASISVKTNPKSKCTIQVKYKDSAGNQIVYSSPALKSKKADEFGLIGWDWPISPSAPAGKWTVTVNCVYNKKSAVVIGDILVK
ncbi:MAG TPA: hypothetical protein VFW77_03355 [Candidatus Saccharimonadales bacterium]|nr:hypothetical protein [Candidatus Saccharimonadales bacterium]